MHINISFPIPDFLKSKLNVSAATKMVKASILLLLFEHLGKTCALDITLVGHLAGKHQRWHSQWGNLFNLSSFIVKRLLLKVEQNDEDRRPALLSFCRPSVQKKKQLIIPHAQVSLLIPVIMQALRFTGIKCSFIVSLGALRKWSWHDVFVHFM